MSKYCFGIDLGGTTVKLGLFDLAGNILEKWEIKTRTQDHGSLILPDIAAALKDKMKERKIALEEVAGAGIGVPGPVTEDGTVQMAVNLGWGKFNAEKTFSELTGLKVKVANDANVAALGEMWKGGGEGYSFVTLATLGTGVGGGIILDGKILTGVHGAGAEIGHMHVEEDETEVCGCGGKGCLEQYASATGIARTARKLLETTDKPSVLRNCPEVSAKAVFDAVKAGDELAKEVAEIFGRYLGNAFAVIAAVVDPEIFVIGGGVSKAGEILLTYINKYYQKNAFRGTRDTKFALAKLGNDAGIYGAAKLVL